MVQIIAKSKSIRMSPRKVRLLANAVKKYSPEGAITALYSMPKAGSIYLIKALKQAIANATHNFQIDPKTLKIDNILVDEGKRLKRMDKSHGSRFDRGLIQKRSTHITVSLITKEAAKK